MAFTEFELALIETAMERFMEKRRPPVEIRDRIDLGFRIEDLSVIIYGIRPLWNDPSRIIEEPVAKTTFVRGGKRWRVYCRRADLKWHAYQLCREVQRIEDFLNLVDADAHRCFWG
jgi:hypothetical protein